MKSPSLTVRDIEEALSHLSPSCSREEWIKIGLALHDFDAGDTGLDLWEAWSRGSDKHKTGQCERNWRGFASKDGGVTIASLISMAKEAGWKRSESPKAAKGVSTPAPAREKPVTVKEQPKKTYWASVDQARREYATLPKAVDHAEARMFLLTDYGLEPHQIPDEWRVLDLAWKSRDDDKPYGPGIVYYGRTPDGEPSLKYRSIRRVKDKRLTQFLYKGGNGHDAILMPHDPAAPLVVTGGEEKGAAAWAAGFNVLCLMVGEKAPDADWCRWIVNQNFGRVVLAFDHDDEGRHATEKSVQALGAAGYPKLRIHAVEWPADLPKGYDLNDAALEADLFEIIEGARPCLPRMSFLTPAQFFDLKFRDDDSILDDRVMSIAETALLLGPGGIGKSRLAYQLAICQINGWDWCGLSTHCSPMKWMFIQVENNARRTVADLGAMLRGHKRETIEQINRHLVILANTQRHDRNVNLAFEDYRAALAAECDLHKPDVVVVDPWIEFFGGLNENDNAEQRQSIHMLEATVRSVRPDASILIVHHSAGGKAGALKATGYDAINYSRGAKALVYAARSAINIAPGNEDGTTLVIACGKNNNGSKFERRAVSLETTSMKYMLEPTFDFAAWEAELTGKGQGKKLSIDPSSVIIRIPPDGEIAQKELIDSIAYDNCASEAAVRRLLKKMEADGLIKIKLLQTGSHKTGFVSKA